jgi:hypothetical protein
VPLVNMLSETVFPIVFSTVCRFERSSLLGDPPAVTTESLTLHAHGMQLLACRIPALAAAAPPYRRRCGVRHGCRLFNLSVLHRHGLLLLSKLYMPESMVPAPPVLLFLFFTGSPTKDRPNACRRLVHIMGTVPTSKRAPLRRAASPPPTPRSPLPHTFSTFYIFFCVGYYFVVSLSLTFINKNVLNKFACPLFMTWLQFVVAFVCIKFLGYAGRFVPAIPNHIGICEYTFSKEFFIKTAALGLLRCETRL